MAAALKALNLAAAGPDECGLVDMSHIEYHLKAGFSITADMIQACHHKLPCRVMSYTMEARELRIAVSSLPDFRKSVVSCHLTKRHTPVGTALLAEQGSHKKMLAIYAGSKAWQEMLLSSLHEEIVAHVATLSVADARDFLGPILRLDSGSCNFSPMNPNSASHDVTHCFSPKFSQEWNEEDQNIAIESAQTSLEQMVCLHYKPLFSKSINITTGGSAPPAVPPFLS